MDNECNISWHFGLETARPTGPNDSATEFFNDNPIESLVRESIQNSLDARNPNNEDPVTVVFKFKPFWDYSSLGNSLRSENNDNAVISNLMSIKEHIIECRDYWNNREKRVGDEYTKSMLHGFDHCAGIEYINCIVVSDYNTIGMDYNSSQKASRFFSFVGSKGFTYKPEKGTGGSFGIGKHAYFGMSQIRTVLTSSKCLENGEEVFMGVSLLATHSHNGEEVTNEGFFTDNNEREPIIGNENIPKIFRREDVGTDMYIIGYPEEHTETYMYRIQKAVIRNFWMAIQENKLLVKIVNDTLLPYIQHIKQLTINSQNLSSIIYNNFTNHKDHAKKDTEYNVRPYFDAYRFGYLNNDEFKMKESYIKSLGKVKFFVYLNQMATNKILYLRKPMMVIYRERVPKQVKYSGVFLCDDVAGDKLLVNAEGPAHNEWKVRAKNQFAFEVEEALQNIQNFIDDCFDEWFPQKNEEQTEMYGSENYISIINEEDDLPEDRVSKNQLGKESRVVSTLETGKLSTKSDNHRKIKAKRKKRKSIVLSDTQGSFKPADGDDILFHTHTESVFDTRKNSTHTTSGNQIGLGAFTRDRQKSYKLIANQVVVTRVIAHKTINGNLHHTIIFNCNREIENTKLQFVIYGNDENESAEYIELKKAYFKGKELKPEMISFDSVHGLTLAQGQNKIEIEFFDNIKYNVDIMPYELK